MKKKVLNMNNFQKGNFIISLPKVVKDEYSIEIVDKEKQSVVFANKEDLLELYYWLHALLRSEE